MDRRNHIIALAVTLAVGAIVACRPSPSPSPLFSTSTPEPTVVDRGLAFGTPCKPPCWEELVPGVSKEDDVWHALRRLQHGSGQYPAFDCSWRGCSFAYVPYGYESSVFLDIEDKTLRHISGGVNFSFDAQQLIDLLGEPTATLPVVDPGKNCTCENDGKGPGKQMEVPVYLLYPDKGASFMLLPPVWQAGCICPHARVSRFDYFPPMSMREFLDYMVSRYMAAFNGVQEADLKKWHGFGPGY